VHDRIVPEHGRYRIALPPLNLGVTTRPRAGTFQRLSRNRGERAAVDDLPDHLLPDLVQLAVDAVNSVSELILSGFRSPTLQFDHKADGSPVTRFDREAEKGIRAFLGKHQPHPWPVLGEELGDDGTPSRYRWVVDPIDGTQPFTRGLPTFGTLLALEDVLEKRSLVGVIHLHALNEVYSAGRGLGAWCGQQRLRVAPQRPLSECMMSLPLERFAAARPPPGPLPHLRCYADCYAHAMVARGALDAVAEFGLARWDVAASEIIIHEAGGLMEILPNPKVPGKLDCILGSPGAYLAVKQLIAFGA
jgi:fructose-1,6-bisphosphatase/inositol monophosphatase family enzyme